ncbi:MAG: hypothetical protein KUG77_28455 [Nannocystaceae bacterium]|nr:hypothetical protein [Nannocystaceae bacterium]
MEFGPLLLECGVSGYALRLQPADLLLRGVELRLQVDVRAAVLESPDDVRPACA